MRWFALFVGLPVCLANLPALAEENFVPLFNGMNLDGWEGDPELWHVEKGVIVGSTENKDLTANSFLATKAVFKNFVLKAKFKLHNHNSGIQFRSKLLENYRVIGYQADITENQYIGVLTEEGLRRKLALIGPEYTAKVTPEEVARHVNKGDWNEYQIRADGPHITLAINGFTTVDYTEAPGKGADEGIVALQLHLGPPMRVEFKEIEILPLP